MSRIEPEKAFESAKEKALAAFKKGSFEESVKYSTTAISFVESGQVFNITRKSRSALHGSRALAYVKLKSWSEAETDCSTALEFDSSNTKARYCRSKVYFELGRLTEALQDVEQVLKEIPERNKDARELRERIRHRLQGDGTRDPPEMAALSETHCLRDSAHAAIAAFQEGSFHETVSRLTTAISLVQSGQHSSAGRQYHSSLHCSRALAYKKLNNWSEVEMDCSAALDLDPRNTKARFCRSIAYVELGRPFDALQDVEQVLKDVPVKNKDALDLRQRIHDEFHDELQRAETHEPQEDVSPHPVPRGLRNYAKEC